MAGEGEGETLAGFSCAVTRSDERGTFTAGSARRGASSVRPLLHSSFFIRNVRPADSCYIRLTRLLGQVVSQGLQFLHNRRAPPTAHRRRRAPIHTAPPHHRPTTADSHHPHRSAVAAALPLRADPDRARCRNIPIRPRSATALNRRSCPLLPLRLTKTPDLARSHFCRFSTISLSPGVFQTSPTPDPPPETKNRSKSTFLANAWQVRTI